MAPRGLVVVARQLLATRNILIVVLAPILFLPIIFEIGTQEAKCAYVVFIMAIFWCTEALPIAVTSLLPVLLVPTTGVMTAKEISKEYINDTCMLFIGGLILAVAVERWNLHKRVALSMLLLVGAEPRWLMLGLMLPTWFLSMWISNTATTAMMIPIVVAVLDQLNGIKTQDTEDTGTSNGISIDDVEMHEHTMKTDDIVKNKDKSTDYERSSTDVKANLDPRRLNMCKGLSIAIAYAANCGGIGSLTGTGPNLVLKGQSDIVFNNRGATNPITFTTWMILCLPLSFIMVIIVWFWLQLYFLGIRRNKQSPARTAAVKNVIRTAYRDLGPMSFAEAAVLGHFVALLILWITRDAGGSGGWGALFEEKFVSDSTPSILIAALLFVFPSDLRLLFAGLTGTGKSKLKPLIVWQDVQNKLPWGVILLLGGGFALAKACQVSGLSDWVGDQLEVLSYLDPWVINLVICYIVAMATEITSNTATATLMMPIMARLSTALKMNPLYFMWPSAIASSFAFMLPVATPPNAIVFSSGYIKVIDMVKAGFLLNVIGVPVIILAVHTWGEAFFKFGVLPPEFEINNITSTVPTTVCG